MKKTLCILKNAVVMRLGALRMAHGGGYYARS